ncbi:methyltransferase domain-containing protein [Natronosporangium hydrolyticum]|uniref:Methyltransferase domain-containing protein n=1 Tax=Natronosporangium hydrolyticum TaxID=2811111 RepID=A0A895Y8K4_9ACTN|nr:class I SAM-dependent methyltransferase [Natronosporangium hydrolyticum]QSB12635.1 methyltransferase domain-containing protein [Natronosporangium hydrolyticum]
MPNAPVYDAHADWYEQYITGPAATFSCRVRRLLADLLGDGSGEVCLDVCCGTGAHAACLRDLGWQPVGVDLSAGQLRHARNRLPVALADAAHLPVAAGRLPAAVAVLCHTDLPDYSTVVTEVAGALRPGGRFVHIGVHPCFVGAFADWHDPAQVVIDNGYADPSYRFDSWTPHGVRARVGAWHTPLPDLLNAVTAAGLRLHRLVEDAPRGVPDLLGYVATRPAEHG